MCALRALNGSGLEAGDPRVTAVGLLMRPFHFNGMGECLRELHESRRCFSADFSTHRAWGYGAQRDIFR